METTDVITRLKKHMEENGLTQHQVCLNTTCQAASLSRWLTGKGKPSYAWAKILEEYLQK